ncbi:hypothetical protein [Thermofilum pendens]|nr:hypothetical protein [Thermofilum pendens]
MAEQRRERRLRLRRRDEVPEGRAFMNPSTMNELGISSEIEVVIAGKKKLYFAAMPSESVPPNEVWCNTDELKTKGVADNSIATVRAKRVG